LSRVRQCPFEADFRSHGWVDETAEIIMAKHPNAIVCKPTFGFFSALHFFLPWGPPH